MSAIAVLAMAYVLSQFFRSFLAVLVPVLKSDLGMSAGELSAASGLWFVTFALMQFPIGYWLDTYGPRRTAAILHGLAGGGGALLFATAQGSVQIIIAMGLIGIGCAPVLMAAFFLFARNYSPARFATLGSTFIAVGTLGGIFSSEPLAAFVALAGWRAAGFALAAITIATAIGIMLLVSDPERVEAGEGKGGGFLSLFRIRALWFIFPCILLGYSVAGGIRGLWAGTYLTDIQGLGEVELGRITLYMAIALAVGTLAYGPLDRLFNSRKWVVFFGNLAVLAAVIWLALVPQLSLLVATLLLVVIGFFGSSYAVQMAHGKAFVPAHLTGRGVTLMNFFSIGGVGLLQFVTGGVFAASGGEAGEPGAYSILFGFYAVLLAIALFIYLFSQDAKPQDGEMSDTLRTTESGLVQKDKATARSTR